MRAARHLGKDAPPTTISPALRSLCFAGEKAITVIGRSGEYWGQLGTPLDPEAYSAWKVDAVSVYYHGELPPSLALGLGPAGSVTVEAS